MAEHPPPAGCNAPLTAGMTGNATVYSGLPRPMATRSADASRAIAPFTGGRLTRPSCTGTAFYGERPVKVTAHLGKTGRKAKTGGDW